MTKPEVIEPEVIEPMSAAEIARRAELEKSGKSSWYELGLILTELKEKKLYRNTHNRWQDYIKDEWPFSRQWANQLIDAAEIQKEQPKLLFDSAKAAKTFSDIPQKARKQAAKRIERKAKAGKPITAKLVQESAAPLRRGGIFADMQRARAQEASEPKAARNGSAKSPAEKLEKWYAENRNRLNEYPATSLDQAFKKAVQFLKEDA